MSSAPKTKIGAQILVDELMDLGVEYIFGYPGGSNLPIYDVVNKTKRAMAHVLLTCRIIVPTLECRSYLPSRLRTNDLWPERVSVANSVGRFLAVVPQQTRRRCRTLGPTVPSEPTNNA